MSSINWHSCQNNSDVILAEGIQRLSSSDFILLDRFDYEVVGNYLVSHSKHPYYIGEAKNLRKRLSQQFRVKTSTFYTNYLVSSGNLSPDKGIREFQVQIEATQIGRKEIEEFGIVNLPTQLNKFQLAKRKRFMGNIQEGLWNQVQNNALLLLENGEKELLNSDSGLWLEANIPNRPGLYVIEDDDGKLIYVGESSDFSKRYKDHSTNTYFSALRRNIGTDIFGFTLLQRNGKKRCFEPSQDQAITEYLCNCHVKFLLVEFGRLELEEYLIRKHKPMLNRKDKPKP